jgi:hypothetical protein
LMRSTELANDRYIMIASLTLDGAIEIGYLQRFDGLQALPFHFMYLS